MLKLTKHDDGSIQYVSAKAIIGLSTMAGFTVVDCSSRQYLVNETPEQILAMPEMPYEMYPAMVMVPDSDSITARLMGPAEHHHGMTFIR